MIVLYCGDHPHNKYYVVDNSGKEVVVFYGRLIPGLKGYQSHRYPLGEYIEIIHKKRKKGYEEITSSLFASEAGGMEAIPDEIRRLLFPQQPAPAAPASPTPQQPAPAAPASPTPQQPAPAAPAAEDDEDTPPPAAASSSPWTSVGAIHF